MMMAISKILTLCARLTEPKTQRYAILSVGVDYVRQTQKGNEVELKKIPFCYEI